jgi:hypothetical protein
VGRFRAGATVGVAQGAARQAEVKAVGTKIGAALAAIGIG